MDHQTGGQGSLTAAPTPVWAATPLAAAQYLYDLGLNVIPQPRGQKHGYPWKRSQYSRLPQARLPQFFLDNNIAVMVGQTSRHLFVLDCETTSAFQAQLAHLRQRGIPIWAYTTARGGHVWLLSAAGVVQNIASGKIPDIEVRGSSGYVLCPPSIHPTGMIYAWFRCDGKEPPTVTLDQIDWLTDSAGQPITLSRVRRWATKTRTRTFSDKRMQRVSQATLRYLETGSALPKGSRNNALFHAACDLLGCGFTEAEVAEMLTPSAYASGLRHDEIRRTLESAASRRRTPSRTHFTPSAPDIEAWIDGRAWTGRTGQTDYKVAKALAHRFRLDANEDGVFRASYRELQERAHIGSRKTLGKALVRLKAQGLIQRVQTRGPEASLWCFDKRIGAVRSEKSEPLASIQNGISNGSLLAYNDLLTSDAAERGALGFYGLRVYSALANNAEPLTVKALSEALQLTPGQVHYALRKLKMYGLARREGRLIWAVGRVVATAAELDAVVARRAGTAGKGKKRRWKHLREREWYTANALIRGMETYKRKAKEHHAA